MKKLFTIAFLFLIICSAKADYWTQKADFGGSGRNAPVGFSIGSKGYIGTGWGVSYYDDFWEYDPTLNSWIQKANFIGPLRKGAVAFSIGNKGYLGTGYHSGASNTYYKDFWEYDPSLDVWTQKADYGGTARTQAVGFSIGSKGYIGIGGNPNLLDDFWEYDPAINIWSQIADFGGTARARAVGFADNNYGYVGLGYDAISSGNDFWKYDPLTNSWSQIASYTGTPRGEAVSFCICEKGYAGVGGYSNNLMSYDFLQYDPVNDVWNQKANFIGGLRVDAVGFTIASKGYLGTGGDYTTSHYRDFWEYTPDNPCPTGITELSSSNLNLEITPNPASQYVVISWQPPIKKEIEIIITDTQGKIYLRTHNTSHVTQIDIRQYASGIYFIKAGNAVGKFVKE